MHDRIVNLAKTLVESGDIDEAREIASELQKAIREHIEDLGTRLYRSRMQTEPKGLNRQSNVVEMPRNPSQ